MKDAPPSQWQPRDSPPRLHRTPTEPLDELARITQEESGSVHREVKALSNQTADGFRAVMNRMDAGFGELAQAVGSVKDDVCHWKQDILELEQRVAGIEKHLGISR